MIDIKTKAKNLNIKDIAQKLGNRFENLYNMKKASPKEFYYLSMGIAYSMENDCLFDENSKIKIVCLKKPTGIEYAKEKGLSSDDYVIITNKSNLQGLDLSNLDKFVFLDNDELKELIVK